MKARYVIIYSLVALAGSVAAGSCADDTFDSFGHRYESDGNLIRFDVSSGTGPDGAASRSADSSSADDDGLSPMILADGTDTLYLHRYVAPESKRATGHGSDLKSRSTQVTTDNFQTICGADGFMVNAMDVTDDSEFFPLSMAMPLDGEDGADVWYMADIKYRYWPQGKKQLRFNAYAPKGAVTALANLDMRRANPTFDYTVPVYTDDAGLRRDAEHQPDLMFASAVFTHDREADDHSDYTPLNFRHALSAIKFAVRDVTKWTIADISIVGVSGKGSCTFTPGADATDDPVFTWDNLGEPNATFTQTFNYTTSDPYEPDSTDPDHEVPSRPDAPVINDQMPEKTFILIPQTIHEDAELHITLTHGDVTKVLKGNLKTADIPLWEPGKEYVYTISTTSVNWTYVFKVVGSKQGEKTYVESIHNWVNGQFADDDAVIEIGSAVTEGSYYKVQSYRYRTNSPDKTEILPWTAVVTDGDNTVPETFAKYKEYIPMTVPRVNWLLGTNWTYQDEGSTELKEFGNLEFAPQYVATDYDGDWEMRAKGEKNGYTDGVKDPVDLSMVYGKRNTANCYVINAGGWYSIPLYYGSSIKNGVEVVGTYFNDLTNTVYGGDGHVSSFLRYFTDYAGNNITSAGITTPVKDAILAWQDAYGIIDQWEYDSAKKQIVFHVDPTYLQQANCVLAIRDNNDDIIWSWHIWITDHWVGDNLTLGNGDVTCEAEDPAKGPFDLAPYNLGWCDPKNVLYLRRSGKMTFTQTEQDGTTVLATKELDVIQRSDEIEYWIGNSTYYQFGRKDPMVGFINANSQEKYNFGQKPYSAEVTNSATLKDWILNPSTFFDVSGWGGDAGWEASKYYNLWNNYTSTDITEEGDITTYFGDGNFVKSGNPNMNVNFAYSATKTVYDPSPPGYVIPAANFYLLFGIGNPDSGGLSLYVGPSDFKGEKVLIEGHTDYFNYLASPRRDHTPPYSVVFNVNGQKRNAIWNMNPSLVYLWSNTVGFYQIGNALAFALGYDTNGDFTLNSYFQATRVIARPVRCIKEF